MSRNTRTETREAQEMVTFWRSTCQELEEKCQDLQRQCEEFFFNYRGINVFYTEVVDRLYRGRCGQRAGDEALRVRHSSEVRSP